ncbi:MAG: type transport system ATP-binding protein [Solirubrobacteraceae bacterium]|jgi:ABC-type polysaccharide/polyol phosphate transport system ATPase subunit|nr:type transport system ATP-binding protein [Solirubrobacteraceae bacterium]
MAPSVEASRPPSAAPSAVSVVGLSKGFRLPHQQYSTLKERILHPFRSSTYDELRAVQDITLEIPPGEFFGIVGRNGSGKSTLLKCLAGIYRADRGSIAINGRLSPFIELGVGFNSDLTARDNVIINAIMLGLTRRQARARFDDVLAFAELEEFVDLKLKNYSSGMTVRLAFAVAIQVDADILLIDEVLAVGDVSFQQKCYEQFHRMQREGKTIVFVTHDMSAVERFCDRVALLERGEMVELGEPRDVTRAYNELNFGRLAHDAGDAAFRSTGTFISEGWFEDAGGERVAALGQGEAMRACFEVLVREPLEDPVLAVTLRNEAGQTMVVGRSDRHGEESGSFAAGERLVVSFEFANWLAPSRYTLSPSIAREGTGADTVAVAEDIASVVVHGFATGGVLDPPQRFEVRRG